MAPKAAGARAPVPVSSAGLPSHGRWFASAVSELSQLGQRGQATEKPQAERDYLTLCRLVERRATDLDRDRRPRRPLRGARRADLENRRGIRIGPLFVRVRKGDQRTSERLSDRAVALIVKARAQAVPLDPTLLAGHSLRSGGITEARRNGHDEQEIAKLSRHRNMDILRGYIRAADSFEGRAQVLRLR